MGNDDEVEDDHSEVYEQAFCEARRRRRGMRSLDQWAARQSLTPILAALLLSGHNPDGIDDVGAEKGPNLERLPTLIRTMEDKYAPPAPADVKLMLATFHDQHSSDPKPRNLGAWFEVAKSNGIKVDASMCQYVEQKHADEQKRVEEQRRTEEMKRADEEKEARQKRVDEEEMAIAEEEKKAAQDKKSAEEERADKVKRNIRLRAEEEKWASGLRAVDMKQKRVDEEKKAEEEKFASELRAKDMEQKRVEEEKKATEERTKAAAQAEAAADSGDPAPLPLTTGDLAYCFGGLRYNEEEWKKPLGDKPKWLRACIAIPGQRGVSETRWNPVFVAAALVKAGHIKANNARAKFQTKPMLMPWLEAWKTYEAEFIDNK